jgi:NADH dehydrogenase
MLISMLKAVNGLPRVVVLGGGYAGIEAVQSLAGAPVDLTLIDQRPYQSQKTRLWQLAVGQPGEGTESLQAVADKAGAQLQLGEVGHIDPAAHQVQLKDGQKLGYDYLVVALGSTPGRPAGEVLTLDQPEDARKIRETVRAQAQAALNNGGSLPIVVVGGGATGVEMAGIVHEVVEQVNPDLLSRLDLRLVHGGRQLSGMPEEAARRSAQALEKLGVKLELGQRVARVSPGQVELESGRTLPASCVLWAAGTRAPALLAELGPTDRAGRLAVNQQLTLPDHPDVFIVGDAALVRCGDQTVPPNKRAAKQEADLAAANIRNSLQGLPMQAFQFQDGKDWNHIGPVDLTPEG